MFVFSFPGLTIQSQDQDISPAVTVEQFPIARRDVLFCTFVLLVHSLLGLPVCMTCPSSSQKRSLEGGHHFMGKHFLYPIYQYICKSISLGGLPSLLVSNFFPFPVGRYIETSVCQCHGGWGVIVRTAAWISLVHCVQCISARAASATEGHFLEQKPLSDQCSL